VRADACTLHKSRNRVCADFHSLGGDYGAGRRCSPARQNSASPKLRKRRSGFHETSGLLFPPLGICHSEQKQCQRLAVTSPGSFFASAISPSKSLIVCGSVFDSEPAIAFFDRQALRRCSLSPVPAEPSSTQRLRPGARDNDEKRAGPRAQEAFHSFRGESRS
jgi:hypothetical protein